MVNYGIQLNHFPYTPSIYTYLKLFNVTIEYQHPLLGSLGLNPLCYLVKRLFVSLNAGVIHIIWFTMNFSPIIANYFRKGLICLNLLNTNSAARGCL